MENVLFPHCSMSYLRSTGYLHIIAHRLAALQSHLEGSKKGIKMNKTEVIAQRETKHWKHQKPCFE